MQLLVESQIAEYYQGMKPEDERFENGERETIDSLHSEDRESESTETSSEVGIVIADSEYEESEMEDEQMRSFGSELDEEQPGLEMGSHSSLPEEGVGAAQPIPGLLSHREWKVKLLFLYSLHFHG
ncbi:unnamed protein product [Cuscuta campestris]|uniref:Uncharacterized protein n=1 Tax=Cuscuta campestris TaxID=132261 RepID=A0A484MS21_9ASTE|nr:unnamed protein product [Cuscuta campestris]